MRHTLKYLRKHKYEAYIAAFMLIVLPALPLYIAAQREAAGWIAGLLALVILGNLLAVVVD
jgi:hypothetical protein